MCALLYYLCLTFSLLHFFLPPNRNTLPLFFFYTEFFNHLESRGSFSVFRGLQWQGSIFWPGQLWGEDCPSHFTFVTSHS